VGLVDGVDLGSPGDGIAIVANAYKVDLAANSGLEFAAGLLKTNVDDATIQVGAGGLEVIGGTYATDAFKTISCPAGTNPVADAIADTLNLTAGAGINITGNAGTDTIDIASTITQYTDADAVAAVATADAYVKVIGDTMTGDLTISKSTPAIFFTDTGEAAPLGRFQLKSDADYFYLLGRNAPDTGYDSIFHIERMADGGLITFSGADGLLLDGGPLDMDAHDIIGVGSIKGAAAINMMPDNDVDDYIQFYTSGNRPWVGPIGYHTIHFRSPDTDSVTRIGVVPNGAGAYSQVICYGEDYRADTGNYTQLVMTKTPTTAIIHTVAVGTGVACDLEFYGQDQTTYGIGISTSQNRNALSLIGSGGLFLHPEDTNELVQLLLVPNGTGAAYISIYDNDVYASFTNYERLTMSHASNRCYIRTEAGGTGTFRNLQLQSTTNNYIELYDATQTVWKKIRVNNGVLEITNA